MGCWTTIHFPECLCPTQLLGQIHVSFELVRAEACV